MSVWVTSLGLGDTICSTPTIRKLKSLFPLNGIDVYTYYPELFQHNPNVDSVFLFDEGLELGGQYTELRKNGYARYIITFFSSIHQPAIDYYSNTIVDVCSMIALGQKLPEYETWLEAPYSRLELDNLREKTGGKAFDPARTVIIHPSITWPTRTWPKENWQKLTDMLIAHGYQVVAVGSGTPVIERRKEIEKLDIQSCPKGAIDLIDKLTPLETVCLLDQCKCVITMDSGLLHLALSTDANITSMFTIAHPDYRLAWRKDGFYHKLSVVPPLGKCHYCANQRSDMKEYRQCPLAAIPPCMPDPESVFASMSGLLNNKQPPTTKPKGGRMQQNAVIDPDTICQQAIQAKLNVYQAKEQFESVLKVYNDNVDGLINLIGLMKKRILELEKDVSLAKIEIVSKEKND